MVVMVEWLLRLWCGSYGRMVVEAVVWKLIGW